MDDEVFVTVDYRDDDFVRVRRLMLFDRLRHTGTFQIAAIVAIGGIGALVILPDPFGRVLASAAGALIGLIAILLLMGWFRAARPMKLPIDRAAIEVSSDGVVLKATDRYARARWRDFEKVSVGFGIFWWVGKSLAVIIPARCLREDQKKTLRALVGVHASETRSDSSSAPATAAEKDDKSRS